MPSLDLDIEALLWGSFETQDATALERAIAEGVGFVAYLLLIIIRIPEVITDLAPRDAARL